MDKLLHNKQVLKVMYTQVMEYYCRHHFMNQTHLQNHTIVPELDAGFVEKRLHKKQLLKVMYKEFMKYYCSVDIIS